MQVAFLVARVPGAEIESGPRQTFRLLDRTHRQPDPVAIWGHALPSCLDADLVARIREDLTHIVTTAD